MSLLLRLIAPPSGSGSSTIAFASSGNALLVFQGSGSSAIAVNDAGAALLIFQGSGSSAIVFADSGTGTVAAADITGSGASVIVFEDLGLGPRAFILDGGGPPPPKDHIPGKPKRFIHSAEPFTLAPDFEPLQGFAFGHGQSGFMILAEGQGLIAWGDGQDEDDLLTLLALLEEL